MSLLGKQVYGLRKCLPFAITSHLRIIIPSHHNPVDQRFNCRPFAVQNLSESGLLAGVTRGFACY